MIPFEWGFSTGSLYFLERTVLSLELLDQNIAECREQVEAGNEEQSMLDFYLKLREDLADSSEEDWAAYNEIHTHLPDQDADQTLVILKGQLLMEKLIREFIDSRLPNPSALGKQQFTAAQCISIAQSMCLDNTEPNWLWSQVKELNSIRNKLAHNLENENIDKRISNFISTVCNAQNLKNRSISNVVARMYGMLNGLCQISTSDEFKVQKKNITRPIKRTIYSVVSGV